MDSNSTANIGWGSLCGENATFWSSGLTLNTHHPTLPRCFRDTVLVWTPCAVFWICLPFYALYLKSLPSVNKWRDKTIQNKLTLILVCCLCIINVIGAINQIVLEDNCLSSKLAPVILLTTFVVSGMLTHCEFCKDVCSSSVQIIFWLLVLVSNILNTTSIVMDTKHYQIHYGTLYLVTSWGNFALITLRTCLTLRSDYVRKPVLRRTTRSVNDTNPLLFDSDEDKNQESNENVCPEERATAWSAVTYSWIIGLMVKGYKRSLTSEDLYDLPSRDKTSKVYPIFQREWAKAQRSKEDPSQNLSRWRLVKVLFAVIWIDTLKATVHRTVDLATELSLPLLLSAFIHLIQTDDEFKWKAYTLGVLLFLWACLFSVTLHYYFMACNRAGIHIRTALTAAIYRKSKDFETFQCLKLSSKARKSKSVGEIVNMLSVDIEKVEKLAYTVLEFLFLPMTIVISLVIIWMYIGASSLSAVGVIVLYLPINTLLARKYGDLQEKQMERKDARLKLVGEILRGIKVLKLYAWEKVFAEKTGKLREEELAMIRKQSYFDVMLDVMGAMSLTLCALAMFATYSLTGNILTPTIAFTSFTLIENVSWATSRMPDLISETVQAAVSLRRVISLLEGDELDSNTVTKVSSITGKNAVSIENGNFTWDLDDGRENTLSGTNLKVNHGQLIGVVGQVGSGKSSLLSAILGEMTKLSGSIMISGSTAYVSQEAWIRNTTLQKNILYETSFNEHTYVDVMEACALKPDLAMLPAGDQTEIGEKGINLSGGQKQRVALARAVYQNNDIYLLDDPLAAVDAHVSAHLFDKVIGTSGLLKHKTRILVTHGLAHLPKCDMIVVMNEGEIVEMGTYDELMAKDGKLTEIVKSQNNSSDDSQESDQGIEDQELRRRKQNRRISRQKSQRDREEEELKRQLSAPDKLIEDEEIEEGSVHIGVLKTYLSACGVTNMLPAAIGVIIYCATTIGNNIWLSMWTDDSLLPHPDQNTTLRLSVYGAFGFGLMVGIATMDAFLMFGGIRASDQLHTRLLTSILRAPMSFFDTTPQGRILNRFSMDMDGVDTELPSKVYLTLLHSAMVFCSVVIISYTTPMFLATVVPIAIAFFLIAKFYIPSGRQLLRILSVRKSPINSHVDESLAGATCIRAFNAQDRFIQKMDRLIDDSQAAKFLSLAVARWLGCTMSCTGSLATMIAAVLAVSSSDSITAGMAALSVVYAHYGAMTLDQVVETVCEAEIKFVCVERIDEYSKVQSEAAWEVSENDPPEPWPKSGHIQFKNYSTRYRPGLDLVLENLSLSIHSGEKIGVVGRTGAGKSSVALSLFRIIEAASGQIIIDGRDTSSMGLHSLRSKLTMIPQDPVLFEGTIRDNLDPCGQNGDTVLWEALEQANMKAFVGGLAEKLNYNVGEGGESLSVGQRQLISMARALLKKSRILILDEATASIDVQTDEIIQTTIRTAFKDCTVITIAHRINTIRDYNRILVLSEGRIVEFDSPDRLLKDTSSTFYQLAAQAGVAESSQS